MLFDYLSQLCVRQQLLRPVLTSCPLTNQIKRTEQHQGSYYNSYSLEDS